MAQEINPTDDDQAQKMHHRLEETRLSLSEKVEALQDKMKDTVDSTRHTVEEAMHSVKQSVQDAIHSVKQAFDVKYQTQRHPWIMVGGAALLGVMIGHLTNRRASRESDDRRASDQIASLAAGDPADRAHAQHSRRDRDWTSRERDDEDQRRREQAGDGRQRAAKPSMKERLATQFQDEIHKVQAIAIGVGAGMLRDWLKRAMPSVASKVEEVFDSATSKMGGEPVEGPVLNRSSHDRQQADV